MNRWHKGQTARVNKHKKANDWVTFQPSVLFYMLIIRRLQIIMLFMEETKTDLGAKKTVREDLRPRLHVETWMVLITTFRGLHLFVPGLECFGMSINVLIQGTGVWDQ